MQKQTAAAVCLALGAMNLAELASGQDMPSLSIASGFEATTPQRGWKPIDWHEPITWEADGFRATARPTVVTSNNGPAGGGNVLMPTATDPAVITVNFGGGVSASLNLDGVGELFIDTDPNPFAGAQCTASLLSTGRHVLLAAHCVTDSAGQKDIIDGADGNRIFFDVPGGFITVPFTSSQVTVHPLYNGDTRSGFDVAVITLSEEVDPIVPRYQINTTMSNEASVHLVAGYGSTGFGATGATALGGLKRVGLNQFEQIGLPIGGITNNATQLTADFDSGSALNDAFSTFFGGPAFTGFGTAEVGTAPGDSGGPSFIFNGTDWLIAGVHSYGLRLALLDNPTTPANESLINSDVDGLLNSSWGEFYVDARVAHPQVASFITSFIVPEPGAGVIVLAAAFGALRRRR